MDSLRELEEDEDEYIFESTETGEEQVMVVASVTEFDDYVVRVTFHDTGLRLWEVCGRVFVTGPDDTPVTDDWSLGEEITEELFAPDADE